MTPVILSRQQLDQLWEIDRSEIIDTLYRLDNGQLRAYREYYDVRGWDPHDRQVYTPIHEACYDRGGIFFAFFDDEQMIAAAALDTLPGIGPVLAGRIVEYRSTHGAFSKKEDLMLVEGIGEGIYGDLRDVITVEEAAE